MSRSENPNSRLGGGMLVASWIGALLLLGMLFSKLLDWRDNPNQSIEGRLTAVGIREVTLQRNPNGHYLASGEINGQSVRFMLDTGATIVSVPEPIAARLDLRRGSAMRAQTANGSVLTYATTLDSVRMGNIELRGVAASINPGMAMGEILLGMSFLKQLEFTQRGNQLTLRQYPDTQ